ncbi:hypothetical protein C8Q77DRAFT_1104923 [Trametes polyzona]|nr:hypothetical protein C8Q77DRAFT_1104923 [Trametes polyzona]
MILLYTRTATLCPHDRPVVHAHTTKRSRTMKCKRAARSSRPVSIPLERRAALRWSVVRARLARVQTRDGGVLEFDPRRSAHGCYVVCSMTNRPPPPHARTLLPCGEMKEDQLTDPRDGGAHHVTQSPDPAEHGTGGFDPRPGCWLRFEESRRAKPEALETGSPSPGRTPSRRPSALPCLRVCSGTARATPLRLLERPSRLRCRMRGICGASGVPSLLWGRGPTGWVTSATVTDRSPPGSCGSARERMIISKELGPGSASSRRGRRCIDRVAS